MAISLNHYYDNNHYTEGNVPRSELLKEQMYMHKMGVKTLYYTNTKEDDTEATPDKEKSCDSGACAI
jgi:hypothetical protein